MYVMVTFKYFSGVGSTSNSVTGIDAMCPSSKEDFTEFEKMLKEKITQFEKSVHYSSFLESLFRELCISCKSFFFLLLLNIFYYNCLKFKMHWACPITTYFSSSYSGSR